MGSINLAYLIAKLTNACYIDLIENVVKQSEPYLLRNLLNRNEIL